ncbi:MULTISPECIES: hypothetical protein [Agrobacterium]|uniref:hypothetical protein n=1 Tax=Agrobacterium TaxID=357 RepID=UPI0009BB181D|nr:MULTISPECIES: hypothetical protein [Agrobacterium]QCL77392.1 hypothetical protein CFBP5499_28455 [Agrobacterium tumefaciens]CUX72353.1 hypothetical protein AGR6A_pb0087 [Agrobacterium sp. NCPPB 925]
MATTQQLLALVREIADPCETLREGFHGIANDPAAKPEIRQASQDITEAIERVFQIAAYIMANTRTPH